MGVGDVGVEGCGIYDFRWEGQRDGFEVFQKMVHAFDIGWETVGCRLEVLVYQS